MARITKTTTWQELGCTDKEAKNRHFSPFQALSIRRFQKERKYGIDRFKSTDIQQLSKVLGHEPESLRDRLGLERRRPVAMVGTVAYLNMSGKPRGAPKNGKPSNTKHGLRVEWLPLDLLIVDPDYQRALKGKFQQYTTEWDWRACSALTVSSRDGHFYVVDGLQRKSALENKGESEVLCVIVDVQNKEDEAELFCKCNVDRTQLSSLEKFWAKVEAGSRNGREILGIVQAFDFCIKRPGVQQDGCSNGTISSIAKIDEAFSQGVLSQVMKVLSDGVTKDNRSQLLSSFYIGGIAYLCRCNREIDIERLSSKLQTMNFDACTAKAKRLNNESKSLGLGGGGAKYFAQALADVYNYRLKKSDKVDVV
ncbi:MAG: hypothetical protein HKN35_15870 [Woeseia sp.]|nr:hypothetical protein [Woeseia sp.]